MSNTDKISPISDDIEWSAKAVAGDCLERVGHDSAVLCLWLDADGTMHFAKAGITPAAAAAMYAWMTSYIAEFWKPVTE